MNRHRDAQRAMLLVVAAYWSDVATVEEVVLTARRYVDEDSPATLREVAEMDPATTERLLPGLLDLAIEDIGTSLPRNVDVAVQALTLAHRLPTFRRGEELDRQAFANWAATAFDEPISGYVECFAEIDKVYAARYIESWGHSDAVVAGLDAIVDECVEDLEASVEEYLDAVADSSYAAVDAAPDDETPLDSGVSQWAPAVIDTVGQMIQALLRSI